MVVFEFPLALFFKSSIYYILVLAIKDMHTNCFMRLQVQLSKTVLEPFWRIVIHNTQVQRDYCHEQFPFLNLQTLLDHGQERISLKFNH